MTTYGTSPPTVTAPSPSNNTTTPPPTSASPPTPDPVVPAPPPATIVSPPVVSPPAPIAPVSSPPPPNDTPVTPPPAESTPVVPGVSPPPKDTPVSSPPPSKTPGTPDTPVVSPPAPVTVTPSPPGTKISPPPPPPGGLGGSSPPPAGTPSKGSGISTTTVVGIAIGGVVVIVILTVLFFCCRKKKRRSSNGYYGGGGVPLGLKDGAYGAQPQQWQHNTRPPPPADHVISMPLKPSLPPGYAQQPQHLPVHNQMSTPPPPPPVMSSSGGSGGSFYSDSQSPRPPPSPGLSLGFSKSIFTYEELAMATDSFSDANLLGQGGFGYVHKGVLPNNKVVAVKQLKVGSGQGEREFQAEVEIISRVHHKHLVSLVGYSVSGSQRMLVYEFVPNNTMEFHLHGKDRPTMNWETRMRIARGSAKGLAYLHEDCHPKIIHRDIKASNILLDMEFEAKVADFGLAKIAGDNNTHISTRVMGTFGYLAPEYAASGKLTEKSDVYSFGVMLLELITGRRPVDSAQTYMNDSLVDWARPLLSQAEVEKNYDSLVDARLLKEYNTSEMGQMVSCAAACVRHSSRRRPKMSQVVRALEGDSSLFDLTGGVKPGYSTNYSSLGSSDFDNYGEYDEQQMNKFRKAAFGTYNNSSNEYSAPTSEYGLNPSGSSEEQSRQTTKEMEPNKAKKDNQGLEDNF